jgi:HNH endonuclease
MPAGSASHAGKSGSGTRCGSTPGRDSKGSSEMRPGKSRKCCKCGRGRIQSIKGALYSVTLFGTRHVDGLPEGVLHTLCARCANPGWAPRNAGRIPFPPGVREAILERDRHLCAYCGDKATHVDHRIPAVRGGSNDPDNLAASCPPCNFSKGALSEEEWFAGWFEGAQRITGRQPRQTLSNGQLILDWEAENDPDACGPRKCRISRTRTTARARTS